MARKVGGRALAKRWGLRVQQALYRRTGDWYHHLTKFPGALLDADGYIIFESEEAFKACPQLRVGKDQRHGGWVSAAGGIRTIPGYVSVLGAQPGTERSLVESLVRPRQAASGQTWVASASVRKAIEDYAMGLAKRHYANGWREVLDVSATESFDLLCRSGDRELRVEVKGTTTAGASVLVTRNEVRHAREYDGGVALFVVSDIVVSASGCSGGSVRVFDPWDIGKCQLEPIAFECRLDVEA